MQESRSAGEFIQCESLLDPGQLRRVNVEWGMPYVNLVGGHDHALRQ
jgi:hypothetical protein